jgi:hypothetical protein
MTVEASNGKLTVEIYPDADSIASDESAEGSPTRFEGLDYVSFVTQNTYGAPALVAPNPKDGPNARPRATYGQKVLYINTTLVPLFSIERTRN